MIQEAFMQLYPNRDFTYSASLKYSAKFSDYNANVRLSGRDLRVNMSKSWLGVSREIQIGCIQTLLAKLFKWQTEKTTCMDLYNLYLKNVHKGVEKTEADQDLLDSFNRVNEEYFQGFMDRPNLTWGGPTTTKLGSYEYGRDLISISTVLREAQKGLLDYVMYHELLHKKHKFSSTLKRSLHHSRAFKLDEARFKNAKQMEKDLTSFLRKKKFWKTLKNWI